MRKLCAPGCWNRGVDRVSTLGKKLTEETFWDSTSDGQPGVTGRPLLVTSADLLHWFADGKLVVVATPEACIRRWGFEDLSCRDLVLPRTIGTSVASDVQRIDPLKGYPLNLSAIVRGLPEAQQDMFFDHNRGNQGRELDVWKRGDGNPLLLD